MSDPPFDLASIEPLLGAFCAELRATPFGGDVFTLATPFLFGDGDTLPIIVERTASGWRLTDRGGAASHLYFDDMEFTEARINALQRLAEADGVELSDAFVLSAEFEQLPTAFDLADFIQAIAHVGALAGIERRAPYQWYVTHAHRLRVRRNVARGRTPPAPGAHRVGASADQAAQAGPAHRPREEARAVIVVLAVIGLIAFTLIVRVAYALGVIDGARRAIEQQEHRAQHRAR